METETCPGCGCEAEIAERYVDRTARERVEYRCTCSAVVIDGMLVGNDPFYCDDIEMKFTEGFQYCENHPDTVIPCRECMYAEKE